MCRPRLCIIHVGSQLIVSGTQFLAGLSQPCKICSIRIKVALPSSFDVLPLTNAANIIRKRWTNKPKPMRCLATKDMCMQLGTEGCGSRCYVRNRMTDGLPGTLVLTQYLLLLCCSASKAVKTAQLVGLEHQLRVPGCHISVPSYIHHTCTLL